MKTHHEKKPAIAPIIQLWLLRILVLLGGHLKFLSSHGFSNNTLTTALGLEQWIDPVTHDFDPKVIFSELRSLHRKAEKQWSNASVPACLNNNTRQLADLVGLSATDSKILEFVVLIHDEPVLSDAGDWLDQISTVKMFHVLSVVLNLPEQEIRKSLSRQGILARSGLVSVDHNGINRLRNKLDLLSHSFADQMISSEADPINLLRGTLVTAGPEQLNLSDYNHINPSLEILLPYLRHATATRQQGVNILLYGAPGTGKSQLTRVLSKELGCKLFEVTSEDNDGDPIDGEQRLRSFRATQSFFARRSQVLIAFDEAEDVFNDEGGYAGYKSTAQLRKAWINRALEENPVPTLWLSNSIHGIDPAFIRRFDVVLELPIPPKKQRERILRESCGDLLDTGCITRIAESESLAPAVVTRVSSVVRSIHNELGHEKSVAAFERLINSTLEAQGHRPLRQHNSGYLPEIYDPAFIQADADLVSISTGLTKARSGRLCLYGPPGTGKTACGQWLAEQLEIPLLVKRASDLISMWVGESEKNISQAFQQAEQEGALLLIDEVDSFLQNRHNAQRGWEVSLVNEMLTQMESFSGVFIASTNLMGSLDQAALRRFDLKVKFDFLRPEQAWKLLLRHCEKLNLSQPQSDLQPRIMRLQHLTPGDFAAVLRQHRFNPIQTPSMLVSRLEAECAIKGSEKASIGFI